MKRSIFLTVLVLFVFIIFSCGNNFDEPLQRNVVLRMYYMGYLCSQTTGIIWDNNHVITNQHLLSGLSPADYKDVKIFAVFPGLQKFGEMEEVEVTIVKDSPPFDNNFMKDLLLLKMDKPKFFTRNFKAPKLANLNKTRKNIASLKKDTLYFVGNPVPYGVDYYLNTVTPCQVIKILDSNEEYAYAKIKDMTLLVLDKPVMPGSSGSGLWRKTFWGYELVGIVNLGFFHVYGDFFNSFFQIYYGGAITSETIKAFMKDAIKK